MKKLWVVCTVILLIAVPGSFSNMTLLSSQANALFRYDGRWIYELIAKSAAWMPQGFKERWTSEVSWILNGAYQQATSNSIEDESKELRIRAYDRNGGRYYMWIFDSGGSNSFWVGSWDEESATLTWEYAVPGAGISGKVTDTFLSDEEYKEKLVLRGPRDILLLDILKRYKRVEE